jgi:hypothetical protein
MVGKAGEYHKTEQNVMETVPDFLTLKESYSVQND